MDIKAYWPTLSALRESDGRRHRGGDITALIKNKFFPPSLSSPKWETLLSWPGVSGSSGFVDSLLHSAATVGLLRFWNVVLNTVTDGSCSVLKVFLLPLLLTSVIFCAESCGGQSAACLRSSGRREWYERSVWMRACVWAVLKKTNLKLRFLINNKRGIHEC